MLLINIDILFRMDFILHGISQTYVKIYNYKIHITLTMRMSSNMESTLLKYKLLSKCIFQDSLDMYNQEID